MTPYATFFASTLSINIPMIIPVIIMMIIPYDYFGESTASPKVKVPRAGSAFSKIFFTAILTWRKISQTVVVAIKFMICLFCLTSNTAGKYACFRDIHTYFTPFLVKIGRPSQYLKDLALIRYQFVLRGHLSDTMSCSSINLRSFLISI